MAERELQAGRLAAEFVNAVSGWPCGLAIFDHHDGGYDVIGDEGFKGYLGSPLACDSMKDFLCKVDLVVEDYQEHLWSILKRD